MGTWVVEVLIRVDAKQLDNDDLLALSDLAEEEHQWSVARWGLGNGFWISDEVEAQTTAEAAEMLYQKTFAWVDKLPLTAAVVSVRAVQPDVFDLEVEQPTVPELVSAVEAAEMLQVSRQRVHELASNRVDFPSPLYNLRTGPLWKRDAIEAFNRSWNRKPGRPRAEQQDPSKSARVHTASVTQLRKFVQAQLGRDPAAHVGTRQLPTAGKRSAR